ncbi:MAG: glycosyltransferase [Candidatus Latescibacteria bacterium]|nr:glycosyltransferase [Candidatus Latescibacterota bacterium]
MVVFLIAVLLVLGWVVYAAGVIIVTAALGRVCSGKSDERPFVSVVIAARNERFTLGACLDSLMRQDYPGDSYEVVVADDRSSDGTDAVLARFSGMWSALSFIRIGAVPDGISPKKHALLQAIGQARGDVIMVTDADCITPAGWISGMVRRFEPGVGMVSGVAPPMKKDGILNSFIRHEYLWNAGLSAGSIALGKGTHAAARNLAYRRGVFEMVGGFGDRRHVLSGDDTLLMQAVQKFSGQRVVTEPSSATHVMSEAPGDLRSLLRQRIRHMSTGRLFNPLHIAIACFVYGFHGGLLLVMLASPFTPALLKLSALFFGLKIVIDAFAAVRIHTILSLDVEWKMFLPNEAFLLLYLAVMPVLGLFAPVKWKEKG